MPPGWFWGSEPEKGCGTSVGKARETVGILVTRRRKKRAFCTGTLRTGVEKLETERAREESWERRGRARSSTRPPARAGRTAARWGAAVALGPQSCGHQSTVAIAAFDVIVRVVPLLPGLVIGGNPVSAERL